MRRHITAALPLGLLLSCTLIGCGQARSAEATTPTVAHQVRATHSPARPAPHRRCPASWTRLAVTYRGSMMSQPFADISITNTGPRACVLRGYPRLAVVGHRGFPDQSATTVTVAIRVTHEIYERTDPGPHRIVVLPEHRAFFSIGTADAYDGPMFTLTRLTVVLPGAHASEAVTVDLPANGPPGHPVPVGLTAVVRSPRV